MARSGFAHRLYTGEVSYDFIGRRKIWYLGSTLVILAGIVSLFVRGLNPSIDFKGGAEFQFPTNSHSIASVQSAMTSVGITNSVVTTVGSGSAHSFVVQTAPLSNATVTKVEQAIVQDIGVPLNKISPTTVGANWGSQITNKAIEGLIVFLILVVIYLSIRFEPKMALAAIIALLHDLLVTAGVYSIFGFQVSPSTVIALLTILGYSLYDTVVVFDKVRENTVGLAGGSRMTFTEAANLAVNQTLVRSINTSVIALLPVAGLLIIGAGLLGAGSLKDLALALFVGLASGAYSSIFIATPLLAGFKEREPQFQTLAKRVSARQSKDAQTAAAARRGEPSPAPDAEIEELDDDDGAAAVSASVSAGAVRRTGATPGRPRPAQPRRRGGRNRGGQRKKRR